MLNSSYPALSFLPLAECARARFGLLLTLGSTLLSMAVAGGEPCLAGDWPQSLGPSRNGVAAGEDVLEKFPDNGPPVLWKRSVGEGVAGVAVAGERVILFHREEQGDRAECMHKLSGEVLWQSEFFPSRYQSTILDDSGPRCVPLIADERVFLYAGNGSLHCLNLENGKTVWTRDMFGDYTTGAEEGYFGAGTSPILSEGRLWLNVGGARAKAGIVALDPATGHMLWQGTEEQASYSSPIETTIKGQKRLLFVTRLNALSLDPKTNQIDWRVEFGKRGPTVNGANPVVAGGRLLLTAAYGIGAKCLKLNLSEPELVWEADDVMSSQFTTPIVFDGVAYGVDGREDLGVARLRAFEPASGKVLWTKEGFGKATLIQADGKLLALTTRGKLVLFAPDRNAYQEISASEVMSSRCLALPALSDGLLFVRDQSELNCLDLRPER